MRLFRPSQHQSTFTSLKLLNPPVDTARPVPDRFSVLEQRAKLRWAVVRRATPQLGGLVPPGLTPLCNLARGLPAGKPGNVAEAADGPMSLMDILELWVKKGLALCFEGIRMEEES